MSTQYAAGDYWGEVVDHGLTESRQKKTPQLFVKFRVLGRVNSDDAQKYDPEEYQYDRTMYRPITANTVAYAIEDLTSLGFTKPLWEQFNPDEPDGQDLRSSQHRFRCTHETYEGETRERWGLARTSQIERMTTEQTSKLDRVFGQQLKAHQRAQVAAQPPLEKPGSDADLAAAQAKDGQTAPQTPPVMSDEAQQERAEAVAADDDTPF